MYGPYAATGSQGRTGLVFTQENLLTLIEPDSDQVRFCEEFYTYVVRIQEFMYFCSSGRPIPTPSAVNTVFTAFT